MDEVPTRRINPLVPALIGLLILAFFIGMFIVLARGMGTLNAVDVNAIALHYAKQQMVWNSGPTVQDSYVMPMRRLPFALKKFVPARVRADVNAPDLIRRFGPNRQIGMVLVHGVYNTLPPDEGVIVQGDALVIVDMHARKGIFLTN